MSFRMKKYLILILALLFIFSLIIMLLRIISDLKGIWSQCRPIKSSVATIDTREIYSNFDFNAKWIENQTFWNDYFESRYKNQISAKSKFPLKVFILPHSHNDPGWLKTFTEYFQQDSRKILDLVVEKLTQYEDMKFIWTEISFLDLWWEQATKGQQKAFKKLVKSDRLEITTGGWVMTDEANVHLYAMLDQLIEGHQWVKSNLDAAPKIGWSIDPFGQGSTVPHLLAKSGFEGAIIQRIHYNWKEYLARHQHGDFYWKSLWNNKASSDYTLLTHNLPFDMYTTSKSCGPDESICSKFDFYATGLSGKDLMPITDKNIQSKADLLVQQYSKTASLYPHNVALILVGGDFAFNTDQEFDAHYKNYKKLMDYVNSNSRTYHGANIQFGTPSDYFNEIRKRQIDEFPSLTGDFFPYAETFTGTPSYWTGFYTTRPYFKQLSRKLEYNLRNAEILFTIAYNKAKQSSTGYKDSRRIEKEYERLIQN